MSFLARLFGGGRAGAASATGSDKASGRDKASGSDKGIYFAVKCQACGEVIRARINPSSELSQDDDGKTYFVRKVLVGKGCFRPIEVQLRYTDLRGKLADREITGGTFVDTPADS